MGPFQGKMILVIVDAYSTYIDTHVMTSATKAATILRLRQTFSTHGLPCTIVSDNGSPFTSLEFQQYCCMNGIKHIRSHRIIQLATACGRGPFKQSHEDRRRWEEISKQGCSNSCDAIASLHRRQQANRQCSC